MMIEEVFLILLIIILFILFLYLIYKKKYLIGLILLMGTVIMTTQIYSSIQIKKIDSIFTATSININIDGETERKINSSILMDNIESVVIYDKSKTNNDIGLSYDIMNIKYYHDENYLITLLIKSTQSFDDYKNIKFDREHIIVIGNSKYLYFEDEFYTNVYNLLLNLK